MTRPSRFARPGETNGRAWALLTPVLLVVAFSAVIPLMTVVNYSVQDIFDVNHRVFVGLDWFRDTLRDARLHDALLRQLMFCVLALGIEIPLGIYLARQLPRHGFAATASLLLFAVPLLIPWNVVGTMWQMFARPDIGLAGRLINDAGISFNYTADPLAAWITLLAMDTWHWTSLVVLLCYAGLRSIPEAYYQAARIDGASRWQTFRHVELPHLRRVLILALLLRTMDSLMVYTEPFVLTGGGPGNSTTFLSQYLTTMAVGQFDLGPAAAFSLLYFLMILCICWLFHTALQDSEAPAQVGSAPLADASLAGDPLRTPT